MANRVVYGNSFSENGWIMVDTGSCQWITVPGTNDVSLQIREGQPVEILGAWAADFNAYVQPLRDADSACWTATNSVGTSNHLSGTAIDLDWDDHPMGNEYAGYNAAQIATIREMLDFYENTVFWGNDWTTPHDSMHFQMGYDTYGSDNVDRVQDFINRKIRADGFSTFQRGGTVAPPPPPAQPALSRSDGYVVLIIQEGERRGITARGIEIALATGLVESNLTIYANEAVPASMAIPHDAVGSDSYSVGIFQQQVRDTGNGWWWGDAATCMDPTSSAGLFYDRLAALDYNGPNSPGSYAQAVQDSAYPDRYDQRFNDAVALYNRLAGTTAPAPSTPGDDELSAEDSAKIDAIYQELTKQFQSRSPLRHLGEGAIDTMAGFVLNTDGSEHVEICRLLAGYGHPPTLALLNEVAAADPVLYPDRQADRLIAQAILADIAEPAAVAAPAVADAQVAPTQVVYVPAPAWTAPVAESSSAPASTGQIIGKAYDALEALKNAQVELSPAAKASIDSLINVLQPTAGASA